MLNSNCIESIDSFYLDLKILFIYFMFYVNFNLIFLWISIYYKYNNNLLIENCKDQYNRDIELKHKEIRCGVSNKDPRLSEIDEDWCMEM